MKWFYLSIFYIVFYTHLTFDFLMKDFYVVGDHVVVFVFVFFRKLLILITSFCLKFFFNCYLAAPRPTFGPLSRGQPHSPDVNHFVLYFRPEGHQEPPSKVGSLSPAKHLVGFEPGTF